MSYDLGGFSVTASTSRVMLIIFAVYSVVIVGFGFYIKYQSKKGGKDGLASFLTGGGGLGAFAIAMIAATNSMAGGTMVAAPGLGYSVGFTAALVYYAGFLTAAYGLGSVGRKVGSCVTAPVPSRSSSFWGCGSSLKRSWGRWLSPELSA